jgi:hypothetical protein
MASCDTFVFLDHVKHTKSGYTRRTKIRNNNKSDQWLTVPLVKHSDFCSIKDLSAKEINWIGQHQILLFERYHRYPFYQECADVVFPIFRNISGIESLSMINIQLILAIKDSLGITCNTVVSSHLEIECKSPNVNLNICKTLGASKYISGVGGESYQNTADFLDEGIELQILDSQQVLKYIIPESTLHSCLNKSIIDLWSLVGTEQLKAWIHN